MNPYVPPELRRDYDTVPNFELERIWKCKSCDVAWKSPGQTSDCWVCGETILHWSV